MPLALPLHHHKKRKVIKGDHMKEKMKNLKNLKNRTHNTKIPTRSAALRAIACILACLTLFPLVTSCHKNDNDADDVTTTDPVISEPLLEKILIGEDGSTEYKIIRSEFITDSSYAKFKSFFDEIKTKTGITFKQNDDYLRADLDRSEYYEIIFGKADRDECREVYANTSYDGYSIKHVGKKIIIAAYQQSQMVYAVKTFFEECLEIVEENGVKKTYYVKDVTSKGSEEAFFNADNPITDYKIVYSKEAESAASTLAKYMRKYTGISLDTVPDSTEKTDKEILVGETNREESSSNEKISKIGYIVKVSGTKIVIRSGIPENLENSVKSIADNYMLMSPVFNMPASQNTVHTSYAGEDKADITEDADFRVMSFNILSEEWTAEAKDIESRAVGVAGCILYYEPDVIGIQEVSKNWYKLLKEYIGDTYVFVNTTANGVESGCYTGLAYNKNKVDLVESDINYYSVYNSKRLRLVNMGLFEKIDTGKRFIVTDTHFNANHQSADIENQNRVTQAKEFIALIDSYRKQYDCPIVMTGDFNSMDNTDPYKTILSDTLITETKYTAKVKGNICRTYHDLGTPPPTSMESIDHIFVTGAVTPLYYTTINDEYVLNSSDHCPIFCDFKFN